MRGGWVNISVIRHSSIVSGEVCEITSDEPHDPQWDPQHKQQAVCLVRLSSALLGFGCVGSAPAGFAWLASADWPAAPSSARSVSADLFCPLPRPMLPDGRHDFVQLLRANNSCQSDSQVYLSPLGCAVLSSAMTALVVSREDADID